MQKGHHLALWLVTLCYPAAAVTEEVARWKVEPTAFCLLVQYPSQDMTLSFNVLDSGYYNNQHNLKVELEYRILN